MIHKLIIKTLKLTNTFIPYTTFVRCNSSSKLKVVFQSDRCRSHHPLSLFRIRWIRLRRSILPLAWPVDLAHFHLSCRRHHLLIIISIILRIIYCGLPPASSSSASRASSYPPFSPETLPETLPPETLPKRAVSRWGIFLKSVREAEFIWTNWRLSIPPHPHQNNKHASTQPQSEHSLIARSALWQKYLDVSYNIASNRYATQQSVSGAIDRSLVRIISRRKLFLFA